MGRTEFLTLTITSEPRLESANHNESEMALFYECMQSCTQNMLDTADIVRDGDVTTIDKGFSVRLRLAGCSKTDGIYNLVARIYILLTKSPRKSPRVSGP
jgi:hypothetical protein